MILFKKFIIAFVFTFLFYSCRIKTDCTLIDYSISGENNYVWGDTVIFETAHIPGATVTWTDPNGKKYGGEKLWVFAYDTSFSGNFIATTSGIKDCADRIEILPVHISNLDNAPCNPDSNFCRYSDNSHTYHITSVTDTIVYIYDNDHYQIKASGPDGLITVTFGTTSPPTQRAYKINSTSEAFISYDQCKIEVDSPWRKPYDDQALVYIWVNNGKIKIAFCNIDLEYTTATFEGNFTLN